jgi:lipoprotein-releasing system permease protein
MCIGIDEKTHASVSDFGKYLQHPKNREQLSFTLHEGGYDVRDHQVGDKAPLRADMEKAGWEWRRMWAQRQKAFNDAMERAESGGRKPQGETSQSADSSPIPQNPFEAHNNQQIQEFDPAKEQNDGAMVGIALASVRDHEGNDVFLLRPGDDVSISVPTTGTPPKVNSLRFTVVDLYESKMSEYDSSFVFVPIKVLQELRGMGGNVTSIQIKLKPGVDAEMVRDILRKHFPAEMYGVYTWRDKQGAILAAVQMEKAVLNILLFLIIAVAGFGILAIFFMIVVEKTRDVGILKSLGASSGGIMGIFLSYGLSLGLVGAGVGTGIGLLFVANINQIRSALEHITGQAVFDPAIYYFYSIPTIVDPFTVTWIVIGALSIAVLASILPALRAAGLHPVEALRYE